MGFEVQNEEKLIDQAFQYGKDGSVFQRYFKNKNLKKNKKVFQPEYVVHPETTETLLKERVGVLFTGASSAAITRSGGPICYYGRKRWAGDR